MKKIITIIIVFFMLNANAQNKKIVIYGITTDKSILSKTFNPKTKKYKIKTVISLTAFVQVSIKNHPEISTMSDLDGNYQLDISGLADTTKNIVVEYYFMPIKKEILLKRKPKKNKKINVELPLYTIPEPQVFVPNLKFLKQ